MESLTISLLTQTQDVSDRIVRCAENFSTIKIRDIFTNPIEAIEKLNRNHTDILILDIDVFDFATLEILKMITCPTFIIGLTSTKDKAINLLDNGFIDFLYYDFTLEDFCKKMSKIIRIIQDLKNYKFNHTTVAESDTYYKTKYHIKQQKDFIFLKFRRASTKIKYDEILFIKNVEKHLKIYDIYGSIFYHTSTLSKMLCSLPEEKFVRLNKSIIVNFSKITKIEKDNIFLQDLHFKLSKTYFTKFMELVNKKL